MSIGDVVPVIFYEIAFLCSFLLLPVLAFRADVENYIFGVLVMYMCIRVVRNRKKTVLPADDKAVFISGCDSGFGHMVATRLDKKGYKVFAGCLFPDGEGAKSLNKTSSDKLQVLPLDVTSDESVKEAGVFVREHLGNSKLWAVINNAGIYGHGDVELCGVQTYMKIANVNMYGMVRVTQEFLPLIRQSQDARSLSYDISDECLLLAVVAFYWNAWYPVRVNINGLDLSRVVNMSSMNGRHPWPSTSAYNASKYGIECISDCLRIEMIKFGVKVVLVEPAMFGGSTNIHSSENVTQHYETIDKLWEGSSTDVKDTYSKQYLRDQIDVILHFKQSLNAKSPDPVIDALEDGVSSSAPRYRYVVQGGPFPVDPLALFGMVYPYLPESVTDWLIAKVTGHCTKDLLKGCPRNQVIRDAKETKAD